MRKSKFIKANGLIIFILSLVISLSINIRQVKAAELEWKSFEAWVEHIEELLSKNRSPQRINVFVQGKYITNIDIFSNKSSGEQGAISIEVNKHENVSKLHIKLEAKEGDSIKNTIERDFTTIVKGGKTIFNVGFIIGKENYDYDLTFIAFDSGNNELQREIFKSNLQSAKDTKKIEDKSNGGKPYTLQQLIENKSLFQEILKENIQIKEMVSLDNVYIDFQNSELINTNKNMEYSLNSTNGISGTFENCADGKTSIVNLVPGRKICIREKGAINNYRLIEISKEPLPPRFSIDFLNEKTLETIPNTVEYSTDKNFSTKVEGTGQKIDLSIYADTGDTIYFRYKSTSQSLASKVFQLKIPKRPAKPRITVNYETGQTVQRILSTIEYAKDSTFTKDSEVGAGQRIDLEKDTKYYFRVMADENNFKGEVLELNVNGQVDGTPSFTKDYVNESTKEIVPNTVEYSYDPEFKQGVSTGNGKTVNLNPGNEVKTLYFRYKATMDKFPGEVFSLEINARPQVTAYTIDYVNKKTKQGISITDEYAEDINFTKNKNNGSNLQISLNPESKEKTLYFRKKATSTTFAGEIQELHIPSLPSAPTYTIDFIGEKIYNVYDDYRIGESGNFIKGNGTIIDLASNLGKNIYFKKSAVADVQFESDIQVLKIPQRPSMPIYTILYANATTAESVPNTVEISENSDFTGSVVGQGIPLALNPGDSSKTLYFRVKASSTNFKGKESQLYIPASIKMGPIFTINFSEERTVQTVSSDMEYAEDEEFTVNKKLGTGAPVVLTPGKDLYFRYKAGYNSFPSTITKLVVPKRLRVEEEFKIDFINEKIVKVNGTNIDNKYEYAEDPSFTDTIKNANGEVTVVPGRNLYFRLRATSGAFASEAYEVMVPERPVVQTFTIDTENKKTHQVIPDTVLYKVVKADGVVEVDYTKGNNTLLDVSSYKGMTIYFKIDATDSNFKSDEKALQVDF